MRRRARYATRMTSESKRPSRSVLSGEQVQASLAALPGWRLEDGKLQRRYQFDDFVAAFGFMTRVALLAERLNHHPDWSNVYARVDVALWTHDAGGITEFDTRLAGQIEAAAQSSPRDSR